MCGEKSLKGVTLTAPVGSPPRVRGKELADCKCGRTSGITPACAGKSDLWRITAAGCWDHPRVCGEKTVRTVATLDRMGSPPRVRGKVAGPRCGIPKAGITPACAGKRNATSSIVKTSWDHPRVCGEKVIPCTPGLHIQGSPPRVRGKGPPSKNWGHCRRITPACAGKSCGFFLFGAGWGDHPRVCGEKFLLWQSSLIILGSPPRVRGKERNGKGTETTIRITPACAGKSE